MEAFSVAPSKLSEKSNGQPEICIPVIIPLLKSSNDWMRAQSAQVLGTFGSLAKPALPDLVHLLSDSNDWIRNSVTGALRRIDRGAAARAGVK